MPLAAASASRSDSGVGDRDEAIAGDACGRRVGAVVGDQRRPARILLAQLQAAVRDGEVGVALAQQALVARTGPQGPLERAGGVGVVRLELDVAGGIHAPGP